jgi:hypothetical protein
MSQLTSTSVVAPASRTNSPAWGVVAFLASAALGVTSVYGATDAADQKSQEHALPFIIGFMAVVSAAVYGLLVPRGTRGAGKAGLALGLAVPALLTLVFYWSGLPIILGLAAVAIAVAARTSARRDGRSSGMATTALVIGGLAPVLAIAALILDALSS